MVIVDFDQYDLIDAEQEYRVDVESLFEHVDAHLGEGAHERIVSFTFRDAYLTDEQRAINESCPHAWSSVFSARTHHNAVRLTNGDVVPIPTVPIPDPPGHMRVSIRKRA